MRKYIDRAALFNSLSDAKTVEEVFAAIQAAPAEDVEPARHWIPVSWENLPEDENKVLCCTVTAKGTKGIVLGYYSRELERWVCGMNSNVIAWMPLPELPGGNRMDDLISRQAAIDALNGEFTITGRENAETIMDFLNGVCKKLRDLPSAERRGRWIDLKCDQCGQVDMSKPNYCPNCGAKMDDDTLGPGSYRVVGGRGGNE